MKTLLLHGVAPLVLLLVLLAPAGAFAAPDGWIESLPDARARAERENRPILALFTGSDWCGFCIQLEKETLSSPEFQKFLKEKVVPLYLDFPADKKTPQERLRRNQEIAGKFGVHGFPTTIFLAPDGETVLAIIAGYEGEKPYRDACAFAADAKGTAALRKALAEADAKRRAELLKPLLRDAPEALKDGVEYMLAQPR